MERKESKQEVIAKTTKRCTRANISMDVGIGIGTAQRRTACVHTYIYIYIYIYIWVWVYVYIRNNIHMYTYTYTYIRSIVHPIEDTNWKVMTSSGHDRVIIIMLDQIKM